MLTKISKNPRKSRLLRNRARKRQCFNDDKDRYDLVSAIAGRQLEEDGRLTILAVGDDDQNIYTFRGSNVRFIRQFQKDYSTNIHILYYRIR